MNEPLMSIILIGVALISIAGGFVMSRIGKGYNGFGRSMKSPEAQAFATKQMGSRMMLFSIIAFVPVLVVSIIAIILAEDEGVSNVFLGIRIGILALPPIPAIILTELAVRRHFDKNGKPYGRIGR